MCATSRFQHLVGFGHGHMVGYKRINCPQKFCACDSHTCNDLQSAAINPERANTGSKSGRGTGQLNTEIHPLAIEHPDHGING